MTDYDEASGFHPLFPGKGPDADPPEVEFILVQREGPNGPDHAKRRFAPEELQSLEQLYEYFGGGNYLLTAYAHNRWSAKERYRLPGKPKSLNDEDRQAEENAPPAPEPVEPVYVQQPDGGMNQILLALMQSQAQASREAMAAQMGAMQAQTQMIVAMLQSSAQQSQNLIAAVLQANQAAMASSQATFGSIVQALATKGGGGGDTMDAFTKGVEFASSLAGGDDETGGLVEAAASLIQGVQAAKAGQSQAPEPLAP